MNRVEQLKQAHPWMAKGECHLLLVTYYDQHRDKHTSDSFEQSIQAYTDMLCEQSEHIVKNALSVAFESSAMSRSELLSMR